MKGYQSIFGGLHIMKNVRYICRRCNLKRPKDGSDINETN